MTHGWKLRPADARRQFDTVLTPQAVLHDGNGILTIVKNTQPSGTETYEDEVEGDYMTAYVRRSGHSYDSCMIKLSMLNGTVLRVYAATMLSAVSDMRAKLADYCSQDKQQGAEQ